MASVFTKIINGEIPCYKIAEDEHCLAFLDINPNAKGHTLCIPKKEIDKFFDLDEKSYHHLLEFARKVAIALEKAIECERVGMAVVGLEVHHAHIHLIPISRMKEMTFEEKVSLSPTEFQEIADRIKSFI
ncbi:MULTISPECIES: HIT family protein [unclassified Capnocytophaga]|jgi:Diadenosine tetraphosphate (Ap4A) hydrolase and other HIT family hydrolases|uniref:HIT family protein n=1 Tax=unclassified Capnocytophaga TaxID=2640652 RepID=UPI000202F4DE|nr:MULTISPECIES: HIT family protein [unclassified Capnocytophaga]EGD33629.1 HIT family protein [Capnocytophaga sp. oral taxon 338 str. F0234]MEB3004457.1 HIT family protein [Capnocytophaga sp. G2]